MVEPVSLTLGIAVGASVSLAVALFGEEEELEQQELEVDAPYAVRGQALANVSSTRGDVVAPGAPPPPEPPLEDRAAALAKEKWQKAGMFFRGQGEKINAWFDEVGADARKKLEELTSRERDAENLYETGPIRDEYRNRDGTHHDYGSVLERGANNNPDYVPPGSGGAAAALGVADGDEGEAGDSQGFVDVGPKEGQGDAAAWPYEPPARVSEPPPPLEPPPPPPPPPPPTVG